MNYFFFFWLHHVACGILVPQPGIEPVPPAAEARSLNHWTAREFSKNEILLFATPWMGLGGIMLSEISQTGTSLVATVGLP